MIIAQKRKNETKKLNDLAQCKILSTAIDSERLRQILDSLRLSGKTRIDGHFLQGYQFYTTNILF